MQAAPKPNVVLFLVDDMGWMDCGVYGSKYYETPHMDKLAKQSMLFTDAYAHPLCSPTRASILSGQYPSRHGVTTASGHQPARPEGRETTLVCQLCKWVSLVHELRQLRPAEELPDRSNYRADVDQSLGRCSFRVH